MIHMITDSDATKGYGDICNDTNIIKVDHFIILEPICTLICNLFYKRHFLTRLSSKQNIQLSGYQGAPILESIMATNSSAFQHTYGRL